MKRAVMIAAATLAVATARADPAPPLPDYDVVATCTAAAKRLNLSSEVVGPCARSAEDYRYLISTQWEEWAPAVRAECVADNSFRDYFELMLCLEHRARKD